MSSGKTYYICKQWRSNRIEVVHPNQLRNSDNVLFTADAEEWNDFYLWLSSDGIYVSELDYQKVEELWRKYQLS